MSSTETYAVAGMTCTHCIDAVTGELIHLDGVREVTIDVQAGRDSAVTVTSDAPLPIEAVRNAVDEAGYTLAD